MENKAKEIDDAVGRLGRLTDGDVLICIASSDDYVSYLFQGPVQKAVTLMAEAMGGCRVFKEVARAALDISDNREMREAMRRRGLERMGDMW